MINKETLSSVQPIITQLTAANRLLIPNEASPIYALNDAAYTPLLDTYTDETGFEDAWLKSLSRSPVMGAVGINETTTDSNDQVTINVSLHSRSMEEAATLVSSSVRTAMKHARNVAGPTVSNVIEMMQEYTVNATVDKEPYEIVDVSLSTIWESPVVLVALDKHVSRIKSIERSEIPPVPLPTDLSGHVVTGSPRFDKAFNDALRDAGMTVDAVFNDIFHSPRKASGVDFPMYRTRTKTLISYLLVSILADKPVPNSGMNGTAWDTLMHKLLNVYGDGCKFILETYESDVASNVLHYDTDLATDRIYLNGPVYDKWLNEGGTPEVILGALLNSLDNPNEAISYSATLENASTLMRVWEGYHVNIRLLNETKHLDMVKNGLFRCLVKSIEDIELMYLPETASRNALISRAKEYVSKVNSHTVNDIGKLCMSITCDVMFYHTPAKYLLCRIEDRCAEGMIVSEAATAVMIEYITDWIASGIGISKL